MPDEYYYQPGVFHKLVMDLLRNEYDSVLAQPDSITKIKSALTRHRRKILEGLEEGERYAGHQGDFDGQSPPSYLTSRSHPQPSHSPLSSF